MARVRDRVAVLLSGGIDSAALAYLTRPGLAVTIDYGQAPAAGEIRAAAQIAAELDIEHHVVTVDCRALGSGDLAGSAPVRGAPASEWWPFRNQLLITLAALWAFPRDVRELQVGSVKTDGFHVDGRLAFYEIIDHVLRMQEGELRVKAPAIGLSTFELIAKAGAPKSFLAWSHSCHKAEWACGNCRGCNKHLEVFSLLSDGS